MSPTHAPRALAATCLLALCAMAAPAYAQGDQPREKVNMVIIYGDDACPPSTANEITVCARKDEGERYRIPEPFRNTPSRADESWTQRVLSYETVGATGVNSCSPVGLGGATGCMKKFLDQAYAEKKQGSDVQFSKMIEAERQKRLSHIDADSAKQQAAVEQAEKDYDARQRKAQDPAGQDSAAQDSAGQDLGARGGGAGAAPVAPPAPAPAAPSSSGALPAPPAPAADSAGK